MIEKEKEDKASLNIDLDHMALDIVHGNLAASSKFRRNKICVFISGAVRNTKDEIDFLTFEVYPQLRQQCREYGIEFEVVDLCSGDDGNCNECQEELSIKEIDRCFKESTIGPCFIHFLNSTKTHRVLPYKIKVAEFESILKSVEEEEKRCLLEKWYVLDNNAVPAEYVLLSCNDQLVGDNCGDDKELTRERLLDVLEDAIRTLGGISNNKMMKLTNTIAEKEFERALANNHDNDDSRCMTFTEDSLCYLDTSFLNPSTESEYVRSCSSLSDESDGSDTCSIEDQTEKRYVTVLPEQEETDPIKRFGELLKTLIMKTLITMSDVIPRQSNFLSDIAHHTALCFERSEEFLGRSNLVEECLGYFLKNTTHHSPCALHGPKGAGKTFLLSKVAAESYRQFSDDSGREPVLIVRYCGISPYSSNSFSLMESICKQISLAYIGEYPKKQYNYQAMIDNFHYHLQLGTQEKPLFVFIDGLEHLADETQCSFSLHWLPTILPPNVYFVVSAVERTTGLLAELYDQGLPKENYIRLGPVSEDDCSAMLHHWFAKSSRKMTEEQFSSCLNAGLQDTKEPPSPLRLRLLYTMNLGIKSYDEMIVNGNTSAELINQLFDNLEKDYGLSLVSAYFGLLEASEQNLGNDDLIDMISCCGDMFTRTFKKRASVMKRVPLKSVLSLRQSLKNFLENHVVDGKSSVSWSQDIFREIARKRYYFPKEANYTQILRQYFSEELHYFYPQRGLTPQPLYWTDKKKNCVVFNRQRLRLIPTAAIKSKLKHEVEDVLEDWKFIAAALSDSLSMELLEMFGQALKNFVSPKLIEYETFIKSELKTLSENPTYLIQHALNCNHGHYISNDARLWAYRPWEVYPWDPSMSYRQFLDYVNRESESKICLSTVTETDYTTDLKIWHRQYLFSSSLGKKIFMWHLGTGQLLKIIPQPDMIDAFDIAQFVNHSQCTSQIQQLATDVIDLACACRDGFVYLWRITAKNMTVSTRLTWQWRLHELSETLTSIRFVNSLYPYIVTSVSHDTDDASYVTDVSIWEYPSPAKKKYSQSSLLMSKTVKELSLDEKSGTTHSLCVLFSGRCIAFAVDEQNNSGEILICSVPSLQTKWGLKNVATSSTIKLDAIDQGLDHACLLISLADEVVFVRLKLHGMHDVSGTVCFTARNHGGLWLFGGSVVNLVCSQRGEINVYNVESLDNDGDLSGEPQDMSKIESITHRNVNMIEQRTVSAHNAEIEILVKGTNVIASAGLDGLIKCWDLAKMSSHPQPSLHGTMVYSCTRMTSLDLIMTRSASPDASTKLWDAFSGELVTTVDEGHDMECPVYSADRSKVVTYVKGSKDAILQIAPSHDFEKSAMLTGSARTLNKTRVKLNPGAVKDVMMSQNGRYLCARHALDDLVLVSLKERLWAKIPMIYESSPFIHNVGAIFLHDDITLITWGSSLRGTGLVTTGIFRWNLTGSVHRSKLLPSKKCCLKLFCDKLCEFCSRSYNRGIMKSWKSMRKIASEQDGALIFTAGCAISSFQAIAMATSSGRLQIRDETSLQTINETMAHQSSIVALKSARDDSWLVSLSSAGTLRMWDTGTLNLLSEYKNEARVTAIEVFWEDKKEDLYIALGDGMGHFKLMRVLNSEYSFAR